MKQELRPSSPAQRRRYIFQVVSRDNMRLRFRRVVAEHRVAPPPPPPPPTLPPTLEPTPVELRVPPRKRYKITRDITDPEAKMGVTILKSKNTAAHPPPPPTPSSTFQESGSEEMVKLDYISNGVKITRSLMGELRRVTLDRLVKKKKMVLVLDLDHTLLHTVAVNCLTPREARIVLHKDFPTIIHGLHKWISGSGEFVTKLRPGVPTLLKQASDLFEVYVYTKGNRSYAHQMLRFLDPENIFIKKERVIAREDFVGDGKMKSLDVVPADERVVVILDDLERVWEEKNRGNVICMPQYNFFSGGSGKPSYAERKVDEKSDGAGCPMLRALHLLRLVHGRVFAAGENSGCRDARMVLEEMIRELTGATGF